MSEYAIDLERRVLIGVDDDGVGKRARDVAVLPLSWELAQASKVTRAATAVSALVWHGYDSSGYQGVGEVLASALATLGTPGPPERGVRPGSVSCRYRC